MQTFLLQTALRHALRLLLLAALLPAVVSQAQTISPPNLMSYQGYLTDGSGNPLGAETNGGPKNYNVVFRFWNVQSAGTAALNELYAEQQTVTVDNGYFSVLLGEGSQFGTEPYSPNISSVFINPLATKLFIEFDVQGVGPGGTDVKIAPRLQLLSSPYAFLAANADNLVNAAGTPLVNASGNTVNVNGASLTIAGTLNAGTANLTNMTAGIETVSTLNAYSANVINNLTAANFIGAGAGMTSLNANNIASGTLPIARGGTGSSTQNFVDFTSSQLIGGNKDFTADVGIGIAYAPNESLEVGYAGRAFFGNGGGAARKGLLIDGASAAGYARIESWNYGSGGGGIPLALNSLGHGYVGIGTSTPVAPLDVEGGAGEVSGGIWAYLYFDGFENEGDAGETGNVPLNIYTSGNMGASTYYVFSDARIKNIVGQSDRAADLTTLLGIQVTDYNYKDTIAKGNRPQKKVIAQQVEQVYPQAVNRSTDVVPDIYQSAAVQDGWVQLATDLKVGERVKLIGEGESGLHEVLEVRAGAFRTDFKSATDQVFVYGREVHDFRSVDYEAISMLNVSATQELARRLEQKSAQVDQLEREMTDLKKVVAQLAAESKSTKLAAQDSAQKKHTAADSRQPLTTASLEH